MSAFNGQKRRHSFFTITNLHKLVCLVIILCIHCVNGSRDFKVAKPSKTQAKLLDHEVGAVVHFNMQTFNRSMKPGHVVPVDTFNPQELSTDQWVEAAKSFGAKYILFTIDHFSGFLMWPSKTNYNYSVKYTKWRDGKGDVLYDFIKSSRKYGLDYGFFYSVHNNWYMGVDNYTTGDPSTQERYKEIVEEQMLELLKADSPYKDPFYIWFDAGILPGVSPDIGPIIRELASDSLCGSCPTFSGNQGFGWVGNENAMAPLPHWYAVPQGKCSMKPNDGDPWGEIFCPANCDTVLREHIWFWRPDTENSVKSTRRLVQEYLSSVGRGCTLTLDLNPDTRGLVPDKDLTAYEAMGKAIALLYKYPVSKFTNPKLQVGEEKIWKFNEFKSRNGSVVLMEDIENSGQLVMEYELKFKTEDGWISTGEEGSTIGHKRIHPFPEQLMNKTLSAISLKLTLLVTWQSSISLREVSVYNWDEAAKQNLI